MPDGIVFLFMCMSLVFIYLGFERGVDARDLGASNGGWVVVVFKLKTKRIF